MVGALRTVGLGLLLVGLVCFAVGTGGFATATADRGIATDTADDATAYVGYDSPNEIRIEYGGNVSESDGEDSEESDGEESDGEDSEESDGEDSEETDADANTTEAVIVTVTNRLDTSIDVTSVDVDEPNDLAVTVTSTPTDISPGESGEIAAELECEDSFADEPLSVTVAVDGDTVGAELSGDKADRTILVTCDGES